MDIIKPVVWRHFDSSDAPRLKERGVYCGWLFAVSESGSYNTVVDVRSFVCGVDDEKVVGVCEYTGLTLIEMEPYHLNIKENFLIDVWEKYYFVQEEERDGKWQVYHNGEISAIAAMIESVVDYVMKMRGWKPL